MDNMSVFGEVLTAKSDNTTNIFKRDMFYEVLNAFNKREVVFLLGPRKCGKTICLQQLKKQITGCEYVDFKALGDTERIEMVKRIENDIRECRDFTYLLDEVTYMYYPAQDIASIAAAYTAVIAEGGKPITKVVFTGSQSVALRSWGRRAFCDKATFIKTDFLSYSEWLEYKNLTEISADTFMQFVSGTKDFYNFLSLQEYLEGCLEETVASNMKTDNVIVGNDCSLLTVDILLSVLYATLFSLHEKPAHNLFFKNNSVEDKIKFLITKDNLITSFTLEEVRNRVAKSYVGKYNILKNVDKEAVKQALVFLYRCDLITLTPVFADFDSSMDVCNTLIYDSLGVFATKPSIFEKINICIKYPMFYVEILRDVLQEDFPEKLPGKIFGSLTECYVRGILPKQNCFEYRDDDEFEVDYISLEEMCAVEITIANKDRTHLFKVPPEYTKILLSRDETYVNRNVVHIPYYEFIHKLEKEGLRSIVNSI